MRNILKLKFIFIPILCYSLVAYISIRFNLGSNQNDNIESFIIHFIHLLSIFLWEPIIEKKYKTALSLTGLIALICLVYQFVILYFFNISSFIFIVFNSYGLAIFSRSFLYKNKGKFILYYFLGVVFSIILMNDFSLFYPIHEVSILSSSIVYNLIVDSIHLTFLFYYIYTIDNYDIYKLSGNYSRSLNEAFTSKTIMLNLILNLIFGIVSTYTIFILIIKLFKGDFTFQSITVLVSCLVLLLLIVFILINIYKWFVELRKGYNKS